MHHSLKAYLYLFISLEIASSLLSTCAISNKLLTFMAYNCRCTSIILNRLRTKIFHLGCWLICTSRFSLPPKFASVFPNKQTNIHTLKDTFKIPSGNPPRVLLLWTIKAKHVMTRVHLHFKRTLSFTTILHTVADDIRLVPTPKCWLTATLKF